MDEDNYDNCIEMLNTLYIENNEETSVTIPKTKKSPAKKAAKKPIKKAAIKKEKKTPTQRSKTIPKPLKKAIWDKYIGLDRGRAVCEVCHHNELLQIDFECGHIISRKNGGLSTIDNLKPICSPCNKSMGADNWDDYVNKLNGII